MCNKCVERYDHHCIFMSTCVGRKNYVQFFIAVTIAGIVGLYFGVVASFGFIVYFTDRPLYYSRCKTIFLILVLQVSQPLTEVQEIFTLIGIAVYILAVM